MRYLVHPPEGGYRDPYRDEVGDEPQTEACFDVPRPGRVVCPERGEEERWPENYRGGRDAREESHLPRPHLRQVFQGGLRSEALDPWSDRRQEEHDPTEPSHGRNYVEDGESSYHGVRGRSHSRPKAVCLDKTDGVVKGVPSSRRGGRVHRRG